MCYPSNNNYYDVPMLYNNYDVVITSKSYSNGCNAGYTSLAKDLDEQIYNYPSDYPISCPNDLILPTHTQYHTPYLRVHLIKFF